MGRTMVQDVRSAIQLMRSSNGEVTESGVKETVKHARKCLRTFDRIREDAQDRHEAHRKERKRRWGEMKGLARRPVPTPILHYFAELSRRAASLRESPVRHADSEDFVLHRLREEDMD